MRTQSGLKVLFVVVIAVILSATLLWAQKPTNIGPKYNGATETTLKGTVEEIKAVPGPGEGEHLLVKTGDQTILVHVGPETFLKEMDVAYAKGDEVEVVGSKIKNTEGQDEILAREVSRKNSSLVLRDKKGIPIWAIWDPGKN
jgi:hypothetical protein